MSTDTLTIKTMDKILDERETCDLECLVTGAFAPLTTYMTQSEYTECLRSMTLNGKDVFSIPIVCIVPHTVAKDTEIQLKSKTGTILAKLTVQECWQPDLTEEWKAVFGSDDKNHPYIDYMMKSQPQTPFYVSGKLQTIVTQFHENFKEYRRTPAEVRALGPWVGFQTRNPLHRSHIELIHRAAASVGGKVLLHPVEGVTQECDIPFPVRMKCYRQVISKLPDATLSILPLSMRMAGPREAVWHAVIRRNYGCSHFIVGRDHAGPSYKKADGNSFYGPLDAQKLALSLQEKIGITILASEELVYCEDISTYVPVSQSKDHVVKNISGTELRNRLRLKEHIQEWFSYPEVVKTLQDYYNQQRGACFYFVGLSGSGKSTLAEYVKGVLEQEYPHRPVTLLDADIIRTHLSKGLGFSKEDRSMNVRRIGYVASEIVKHGGIVLVANIAPYQADRDFNKSLISQFGDYVEFYIDTPIDECERRDVKGLYAMARAGKIGSFTGVSDPFEIPEKAIRVPFMEKDSTYSFVWNICKKYVS